MANKTSKLQQWRTQAEAIWDERNLPSAAPLRRWQRFVHFWVLVARSFSRNRCPVRASALAYTSLLALIPMLAVVMSITSTFLKNQGEQRIYDFIGTLVASVTPPAALNTNLLAQPAQAGSATNAPAQSQSEERAAASLPEIATNSSVSASGGISTNAAASGLLEDEKVVAARKAIARQINGYIQNTRSGTLGVTGSIVLIFVAISMLSRIETTFNDIWGVQRGRSWFMRIVLYWGVLSLAPLLLVVAVGLATGPHLDATKRFVATLPFIGNFIFHFGFQLLPVLVLCVAFGAFYMLMPNTRVHWGAALVGGLVGGLLFHLNSLVSVLYVSRVVSNSKIYGSLGLVPVFMIGLYLAWLVLLFGAQVAYAYQNRSAYIEARQIEQINQRGREFISLRLMTILGERYVHGEPPPSLVEMAQKLCVPSRLLQQLLQTLSCARLVVETAGADCGYLPARPLDQITCHDVLLALRASQGQELTTGEGPASSEVYGEFQRIQEAERQAASSVTMLALVNRAQRQLPG